MVFPVLRLLSSVASVIRWASPPERVVDGCPSLIYPKPTSLRVFILLYIVGTGLKNSHASSTVKAVVLADPTDKSEVGASIPGLVSKIHVKAGDKVTENQVIAIVEAMKMETSVTARMDGIVDEVLVKEGDNVKAGELMIKLKL